MTTASKFSCEVHVWPSLDDKWKGHPPCNNDCYSVTHGFPSYSSYVCLIEAAPSLSCAGSSRGQYCIVTLLCSQPNWCRPQQRPVDADCCCHEGVLEVLSRLSVQVVRQNIESLNCIIKQTSLPLHSSPFYLLLSLPLSLPLSHLPLPPSSPVDRSESCFPSSTRPTRGLPRETQTKMRGL